MTPPLTILGIESSCDDTAAALVRLDEDGAQVLASVVKGQGALHDAFGGVVPEIAARAHAEKLDICVTEALAQAKLGLNAVDAVAVTAGPGLIGGVVSGVMCAKGIAAGAGLPLIGVNHLAGHALTPRLTDAVAYPYLMLLVSGGHCQYLIVRGPDDFTRLGGTIDDDSLFRFGFEDVVVDVSINQRGIDDRAELDFERRFQRSAFFGLRALRKLSDREGPRGRYP